MPHKIEELTINNTILPTSQQGLLTFAFGQPLCNDTAVVNFVRWTALPIIAVLLFILFVIPPVNNLFANIFPSYEFQIAFKAFIIFLILMFVNLYINKWQERIIPCKF